MIARLIMATPFGAVVRWLAGGGQPPDRRTLDERIADSAAELLGRGWSPMAALAAAEAVETGRELGLYFNRVELDDVELRWYGVYTETASGPEVRLPLPNASEAHQRGYAVLN